MTCGLISRNEDRDNSRTSPSGEDPGWQQAWVAAGVARERQEGLPLQMGERSGMRINTPGRRRSRLHVT
jgi:hypothetical protein